MKENKQPAKQVRIAHEVYEKLLNIGDKSYSISDKINYLIEGKPYSKQGSVPYAVAQASILANMKPMGAEDYYIINRQDIIKKVPEQLIKLGWDKIHPEFFQKIESWQTPMKIFLDNVIRSMLRDKIISRPSLDPREYPELSNDELDKVWACDSTNDWASIIEHLKKTYLLTAEGFLSTYQNAYSIRMTQEELL